MKIIERSNSRLAVRSDPYGQIIFGMIFFLSGVAITYFFSRSTEIVCRRPEPQRITCTLTEKLLGWIPVAQKTVDQVQGAQVERRRDSDGDNTYRVSFLTAQGPVPLQDYWSSGSSSKGAVAEQINVFVADGGQSESRFTQPMEWFTLLFLLMFGGVGLGMVLGAQVVLIDADRNKMTLMIEKDGLLGVKQNEYPLNEVEDVYVDSHRSRKGGRTYRVVIRMASGDEIPLSSFYSSGRKSKDDLANQLRNFLNQRDSGIIQNNVIQDESTWRFG